MAALMVFIVFLIAIAVSVPIGVAMCLGTLFPQYFMNAGAPVDQLINFTLSGADSTPILAVPLFILGGVIMAEGGISRRLFNFFSYFVGNIPGGVPCAAILTCLFYGAISGSGPATTAAVGSMCIPFMVEMGYEKRWSAGLIAVAGGLGVIIPPSIPFVLYSLATGVSTGDLFLAGVIPGILIGVFMMAYAVIFCVTKGEDKQRIRAKMSELRGNGFLKLFADSFFALLCPIIVLGGIYSGIVTPTEAACVSVFYALFVSLVVYRSITLKDLIPFLASSVKTYGGLAFVLAFATAFGRVLSLTRATKVIEDFIVGNLHHFLERPVCPGHPVPDPGHGHGYRPRHRYPGPHPAARCAGPGCGLRPLWRHPGVLSVHRPGHASLRPGPVRGRKPGGGAAYGCRQARGPLHHRFPAGPSSHYLCEPVSLALLGR